MKKIIILLIFSLLFVSCGSKVVTIDNDNGKDLQQSKNIIEKKYKKNTNDYFEGELELPTGIGGQK